MAGQTDSYFEEGRSLRDFLTILFKRRWLIVAFFLSTVLLIGLWTVFTPPTYEVTASILLKKSRAEVSLSGSPNQVTEEDLNSEIHILMSRDLIEEVLQLLNVNERQRPKSLLAKTKEMVKRLLRSPQPSHFDEMILEVEKYLTITPIRRSNILDVSYRSNDPVWATDVVRTLTERYLERRTKVYQPVQALRFFEHELQTAENSLAKAEDALHGFLNATGVTMMKVGEGLDSLAAQKQLTLEQLGGLEGRLAEAQAVFYERQDAVAALESRLASEPERLLTANRYYLDPAIEEIEKGLVALKLRRDALIQNFSAENRQVQDIEAQIRLAEEQLREVGKQVGAIDRTEMNPVHQEIKTQLLRAQADLEGARARYETLKRQVADFRRTLEDLNRKSFDLEKMRREAESAEETYLLYRRKHEEARISAAMDQEKIVNVSIAQPARKPIKPISPKKTLNLAIALFVGTFGGLGLAVGAEYFDHTFTTGLDLERRLGIPHLASIPDERTPVEERALVSK